MPTHRAIAFDSAGCDVLAGWLGDTPETTISLHLLRRRLCSAYALGEPGRPDAVVIQPSRLPEEPMAYGTDVGAIWSILRRLQGWTCINVDVEAARHLGPLMETDMGRDVRQVDDVYHTLDRPVAGLLHPAVRSLTRDDQALLEDAPADLRDMALGFGSFGGLLDEGVAAGAMVDGGLVALACTTAQTERHADVGVVTVESWRGRGLATACAFLVADDILRSGRVPVWSTGDHNTASIQVARKLGFREVGRRAYLVPVHDIDLR